MPENTVLSRMVVFRQGIKIKVAGVTIHFHHHLGPKCSGSRHDAGCKGKGAETSCKAGKIPIIRKGVLSYVNGFACTHVKVSP